MQYEVAIYNQEVKDAMRNGDHHKLADHWADTQYITVNAGSEEAAIQKVRNKYPADLGYVIDHVQQSDGF